MDIVMDRQTKRIMKAKSRHPFPIRGAKVRDPVNL